MLPLLIYKGLYFLIALFNHIYCSLYKTETGCSLVPFSCSRLNKQSSCWLLSCHCVRLMPQMYNNI